MLLVDHIGNDLSRIENEIDKIAINLWKRKGYHETDVEQYVGVARTLMFLNCSGPGTKNLSKAIQIIQYFEGKSKAAPIQLYFLPCMTFSAKYL
jgi:DNA polymerase-3 subunit delta